MEAIKKQLSNTVQEVLDGHFSALESYAELSVLKKHLETCIEKIKQSAVNEATKEDQKTFQKLGFEFTYSEGRRSYDFKHIPAWSDLTNKRTEIEKLAKIAADGYVKSTGKTIVDENGEVIEPCIVKYSSPILQVKKL